MNRLIPLAFAPLLLLTACGQQGTDTIDVLTGSLKTAEKLADFYVVLPLCPQPTPCRERGIAAKIGDADTTANGLLVKYRAGQVTASEVTAAVAAMVALVPVKK